MVTKDCGHYMPGGGANGVWLSNVVHLSSGCYEGMMSRLAT